MASALNRDQFKYITSGEYGQSDIDYSESLMGYEGAGIVTEVGEGVDKSWIGKEVIPIGAFNVKKYGTLGEEAIVPAERLIEKPKNISFINGTAIWVPFITAYGLISSGNIKKGDTVLITAANSVVGMAAIEIAEKVGAIPIGTVRSEKNREKLRKLGIKNIIISGEKNFKEEIFKLTDGKGGTGKFSTWPVPVNMLFVEGGVEYARAYVEGEITEKVDEAKLEEIFTELAGNPIDLTTFTNESTGNEFKNFFMFLSDYITF